MERESGFYWVRSRWKMHNIKPHEWFIAEWYCGWWWVPGESEACDDDDLQEIDERQIKRQFACKDESLNFKGIILTGEPIKKNPK